MSHTFKHKNVTFHYNSDYSGDATITIATKYGPQTSHVPASALAALAAQIVGRQLESFLETDHLGYVTAKTEDEAYEKALESFGDRRDTDGTTSIAVRRG